MLVRITESGIDGMGRVRRRRGQVCDLPREEAERLMAAGFAVPHDADFDSAVATLRAGGVTGVAAGASASPKLLAACAAAGLAVHDDLEVEREADPGAAPEPDPEPKPKPKRAHRARKH